jgi:glycosyltransferase involved in cell wall biosynthesis
MYDRQQLPPVSVSIVVPAYDEAEALRDVVDEYRSVGDEIVVVDDGSGDGTGAIADDLGGIDGVVVRHHDTNRGKAHALRTGVEAATGDVVVFTDADTTYPADVVPELLERLDGGADLVLGSRLMDGGGANIPRTNRIGNRLLTFLVSIVGGVSITDAQTGLRAMRRDRFDELDPRDAVNLEFETRMTARAAKKGYRVEEIPIEYRERVGETKLKPVRDGYRMFRAIVDTVFEEATPPVRVSVGLSVLLFFAGSYTGLVSVVSTITTGDIQHDFYPLLTVFFFIVAFQLFVVVLIADQIKHRIDRLDEEIQAVRD